MRIYAGFFEWNVVGLCKFWKIEKDHLKNTAYRDRGKFAKMFFMFWKVEFEHRIG